MCMDEQYRFFNCILLQIAGDMEFKQNKFLPPEKQIVTANPDVDTVCTLSFVRCSLFSVIDRQTVTALLYKRQQHTSNNNQPLDQLSRGQTLSLLLPQNFLTFCTLMHPSLNFLSPITASFVTSHMVLPSQAVLSCFCATGLFFSDLLMVYMSPNERKSQKNSERLVHWFKNLTIVIYLFHFVLSFRLSCVMMTISLCQHVMESGKHLMPFHFRLRVDDICVICLQKQSHPLNFVVNGQARRLYADVQHVAVF